MKKAPGRTKARSLGLLSTHREERHEVAARFRNLVRLLRGTHLKMALMR
jgi:hypothetical protein